MSHLDLIENTNQGFNNEIKITMKFSTPYTTLMEVVQKQDMGNKLENNLHKRYHIIIGFIVCIMNHPVLEILNTMHKMLVYTEK